MPMYLSILLYQIKYVISKSHREITYDLSRYIILFSDVNYLRLSLLGIWVRHSIISDKVILVDFIHSHTAIGTTTIFLIYKTMTPCLLRRWYLYKSHTVKFICPVSACRLDHVDNDWCCGNTIRFYRDGLLRRGYQPHHMILKVIADTLLPICGICCYYLGRERRFIDCQVQSHKIGSQENHRP